MLVDNQICMLINYADPHSRYQRDTTRTTMSYSNAARTRAKARTIWLWKVLTASPDESIKRSEKCSDGHAELKRGTNRWTTRHQRCHFPGTLLQSTPSLGNIAIETKNQLHWQRLHSPSHGKESESIIMKSIKSKCCPMIVEMEY